MIETYPIHNLADNEFEDMVVMICQKILGIGVVNFAAGRDGGRDARFDGKAEKFPSTTAPWIGKFIVQAKHSSNPIDTCSSSGFKKQLKEEYPKVKKLIANGELEHYLLFTNRKLTGDMESKLIADIKENTAHIDGKTKKTANVHIFGYDLINSHLRQNKSIVKDCGLSKFTTPLRFYDNDIKEIIQYFKKKSNILAAKVADVQNEFKYLPMEEKNQKNALMKEYFDFMVTTSIADFSKISSFLGEHKNKQYLEAYKNTVAEIQSKILVTKDNFDGFGQILDTLYDFIFENNKDLTKDRRLIHVFLHFMYFNCDIGVK